MSDITTQNNKSINNLNNSNLNYGFNNLNNQSYSGNIAVPATQTGLETLANNKSSLDINGEEFVLLGVNSPNAKFTAQPTKSSATTKLSVYKKANEPKEGEIHESIFSAILPALFPLLPGGELLELLNHGRETFSKITEGKGQTITFTETKNINPVDAINPNKAFLPVTPFYIPTKPAPLLWDRVKKEATEIESKKRNKKSKGLGAY
jgi:hypothetical protein